jgi:putative phosphoribosyl transferase
MRFRDREHAAFLLAERLEPLYQDKHPLVLGLPRGAVPMAKIIADALGGDLDVVLVRKLSHPDQPELAIGAIDERGNTVLSDWAVDIEPIYLNAERRRQLSILCDQRARYTPYRAPIDPAGRVAIVVDDGMATGSTMLVALRVVRAKLPRKLIAAVAVASAPAARAMVHECDDLVCLAMPADFSAVGEFFDDFAEVPDEDVIALLRAGEPRVPTI